MKEHITPKQAQQLAEGDFYNLFKIEVKREDWYKYHHKKVTIPKLLGVLKKECHFDLNITDSTNEITVYIAGNDQLVYNNQNHELIDLLYDTVLFVHNERRKSKER